MYIYNQKFADAYSRLQGQPRSARLAQRRSYLLDPARKDFLNWNINNSIPVLRKRNARYVSKDHLSQINVSKSGIFGEIGAPTPANFSVYKLPEETTKIPSDRALLAALRAIRTNEARALVSGFLAFGKRREFEQRLLTALKEMRLPGEKPNKYEIYLARLGAEAFLLGVTVSGDKRFHIGFVDHPSRLINALTQSYQQHFLHFAIRRLLAISLSAIEADTHRKVLLYATALFTKLQSELAKQHPLTGLSKPLMVAYRRLLVAILWKHYHLQMNLLFERVRRSKLRYTDALAELQDLLRQISITLVLDEDATLPTFHTTSKEYRDYFTPSDRTDIGFTFFSRIPRPEVSQDPSVSFRTIIRRRRDQLSVLGELRKASDPHLPPNLHNGSSWQIWLRNLWDGKWRGLFAKERLIKVLDLLGKYFGAFTAHVPYDLKEGCSERNYLTRWFPRAVTGAIAHDCAIYAVRWIHMLGRIFASKSPAPGIKDPKIFLIEMPGHVGVMIRATMGHDVVLSFNNKVVKMHNVDRGENDEFAARLVVQDQYPEMRAPFIMTQIRSSPSDATALWKEVCRILSKKLQLPYSDSSEPHLPYLAYNAGVARIARLCADTVAIRWLELQQRLNKTGKHNGAIPRDKRKEEIKRYYGLVEASVKMASAKYKRDVHPLIDSINQDVQANRHRILQGNVRGITEPSGHLKPWETAWLSYRSQLEKAIASGDIALIHPETFFPDDDFVAAL